MVKTMGWYLEAHGQSSSAIVLLLCTPVFSSRHTIGQAVLFIVLNILDFLTSKTNWYLLLPLSRDLSGSCFFSVQLTDGPGERIGNIGAGWIYKIQNNTKIQEYYKIQRYWISIIDDSGERFGNIGTKVQETKIQKYYKKLMNLVKGLAQGE